MLNFQLIDDEISSSVDTCVGLLCYISKLILTLAQTTPCFRIHLSHSAWKMKTILTHHCDNK